MEKVFIYTATGEKNAPLLKIAEAKRYLEPLIDTFNALKIGHLSQEMIGNNAAAETSGCGACRGIPNFSHAESFIVEYLVDAMGGGASINGLKIGREQLKRMAELPDPERLKPFERAFQAYKHKTVHIPLPAIAEGLVRIENGQLVVNEEEVKERQERADKYIDKPEAIAKFRIMEQTVDNLNYLNELFTGAKSKLIKFNFGDGVGERHGEFHAIRWDSVTGKFYINRPIAYSIVSR
jgi:hypothetical protein